MEIYQILHYEFYNIFREKSNFVHAKKQQKISHKYKIEKKFINYNSKILFNAEIYNQFFNTEKKLINKIIIKQDLIIDFFQFLEFHQKVHLKLKNINQN